MKKLLFIAWSISFGYGTEKYLAIYYINHYKQCEIVKMLGVSKLSVSRSIMGDSRYIEKNEKD